MLFLPCSTIRNHQATRYIKKSFMNQGGSTTFLRYMFFFMKTKILQFFICHKNSIFKALKKLVTGFCKVLYQLVIKVNFFVNIFITQQLFQFPLDRLFGLKVSRKMYIILSLYPHIIHMFFLFIYFKSHICVNIYIYIYIYI